MTPRLDYKKLIKSSLRTKSVTIKLPTNVIGTKIFPLDPSDFTNVAKLLIACFCRHPRRILERIQRSGDKGIEEVVANLFAQTLSVRHDKEGSLDGVKVWRGTTGEVLATAYVIGFTQYIVPVFKLRLAPNRRVAMHGDDLLGFQFTSAGEPLSLLVAEAKNWHDIRGAIKAANATLLKVKQSSPTLLDFIINQLDMQGRSDEAKMVERFLDEYDYKYKTDYLAFVVADERNWKDELCLLVTRNPATPLEIAGILIKNVEDFHDSLILTKGDEPRCPEIHPATIDDIADTQRLLDNSTFKDHHSKLASAALAADLQIEGREKIQYGLDAKHIVQIEKAAHFLGIVGARLSPSRREQSENLLRYAARILERLAIWQSERGDRSVAAGTLASSALAYNVAGYDANARVLMDVVSKMQDSGVSLMTPGHKFSAFLLAGKIPDVEDEVAQLVFDVKKYGIEKATTEEEWAVLVGEALAQVADLLVAKSFCLVLHYLRVGKRELVETAIDSLQRSIEVYSLIGEYASSQLSSFMTAYCRRLLEDSPHALLPKYAGHGEMDDSWRKYVRRLRLGKFPMIFLWNSQKEALKAGLLGTDSLLISMPTSAGKTRTVELAIYNALKDNPDGVCVYIVPSRALAVEVEENLASRLGPMGLAVSVLYGGYDFSPLDEQLLAENRIFVLTPEKLDLVVRQSDDFKKKICLVVIDEAQDVGSPTPSSRTLQMEFIFSRILDLAVKNNARVLCLSAMISNREDFARWISGKPENVIHTEWQPTFKRYGLFEWADNYYGRILYPPIPNEFPTESFYVPLLFNKQNLLDKDRGRFEIAARISIFYSRTGPTLVFTTTKTFVEQIVDRLMNLFKANPPNITPARQDVASRCARILGEDHDLVKAIKLGFCYHHADVPRSIRRILEKAIRDGSLNLIVSTTTLAQGVNLPIKNVVVHTLSFGNWVSATQFWNAAGRAGRAGYETEGHVVFCSPQDLVRIAESELEKSESFVASGIRLLIESRLPSAQTAEELLEQWALASTPQFRGDGRNYDSWGSRKRLNAEIKKQQILTILDSQLLAWSLEESVDEVDENIVGRWISRTLFSVQTLDIPELITKFRAGLTKRAVAVKQQVPDGNTRKLYNRTGLSISSNRKVAEIAQELKPMLDELQTTDRLPRDFWARIHRYFCDIPETSSLRRIQAEALADWVGGAGYGQLAVDYFNGDIEATVRNLEEATFSFPWGVHSLIQHISAMPDIESVPKLVAYLPSLVSHGVPTLAAAYAINLGITDRQLAIKIGDVYLSKHKSFTFFEFKEWLQTMEQSELQKILESEDPKVVYELYQKISTKKDQKKRPEAVLEFNLSDMTELDKVANEDLIVVRYANDFWLCTFDYRRIAKLAGANLTRLHEINRRNIDLIIENYSRVKKTVSIRVM